MKTENLRLKNNKVFQLRVKSEKLPAGCGQKGEKNAIHE